ncbi:MAG: DNA mismatch repair endonuclease MutL [Treponema sp.]|nr:DNA mismatch repair endonuclease MutL [Treponema sp.]
MKMTRPPGTHSIEILPPEEARRIAAGEVIDRPSALVREFLDNALDAGSDQIELLIEEGGVRLTEVVDNGHGMTREDLERCWLPHATSKIRSLDDLNRARTLGFRGEALAAAAAVSRLEVLSSQDESEAWLLRVGPGEHGPPCIEPARRRRGTSIRSLGLYDTIPARKRFLKRAGSEAASCRQIFNEKALAFPGLTFRFTQDGVLKSFFPALGSYKERFAQICLEGEGGFLHEIHLQGEGFSLTLVFGGPELYRQDRRLQFVFANNRRIQDYSFLQALEYGLDGLFPNGTHPVGAVFLSIDPGLADFNIHPAKREARFMDRLLIHHTLSSGLRSFAGHLKRTGFFVSGPEDLGLGDTPSYAQLALDSFTQPRAAEYIPPYEAPHEPPPGPQAQGSLRYLGRLFNLFILVQRDEKLYIIDQHAAHEGILYHRFTTQGIPVQELLVAIPFETEDREEDAFLEEKREELSKLGLLIRHAGDTWNIEALPSGWTMTDQETLEEIRSLRNAKTNLAESWLAKLSCSGAVKDGDYLDPEGALKLAKEAFDLPFSRCPHGRPMWVELSRDELLKAVKRT